MRAASGYEPTTSAGSARWRNWRVELRAPDGKYPVVIGSVHAADREPTRAPREQQQRSPGTSTAEQPQAAPTTAIVRRYRRQTATARRIAAHVTHAPASLKRQRVAHTVAQHGEHRLVVRDDCPKSEMREDVREVERVLHRPRPVEPGFRLICSGKLRGRDGRVLGVRVRIARSELQRPGTWRGDAEQDGNRFQHPASTNVRTRSSVAAGLHEDAIHVPEDASAASGSAETFQARTRGAG